ncbi:MAG: YraN family protein [Acidimicrobiales bacterium]
MAAAWYRRRGYEVLARNWRCRHGELDLVLRRAEELVFCEVKTRSSEAFGLPAEAVTVAKRRRIRRLAAAWIHERRAVSASPPGSDAGNPFGDRLGYLQVRFDVATVRAGFFDGAQRLDVEVIEGAF